MFLQLLVIRTNIGKTHRAIQGFVDDGPWSRRAAERSCANLLRTFRAKYSLHDPGTMPRITGFHHLNLLSFTRTVRAESRVHFFPLLLPGLAALLRSSWSFAGASFFARMTLSRSVLHGFSVSIQVVQRSVLRRSR